MSHQDVEMPTVVLVDDAAEVRLLVRTHLSLSGEFEVVAEGSDGLEAIELAREFQPTLMVLDVSMPRMDGLEALPQIREVAPDTRVVLYTGFDEAGLAPRARELGAAALIEKSTAVDQLPGQLAAIVRDEAAAATVVAQQPDPPLSARAADESALAEHVERFREVFEEAAIGMATMTLTGHIVRANRALAALVGRSVENLVGLSYAALSADADPGVLEALRRAQRGDVVHFEHQVAADVGDRWLLATAAPVKDARNRPLYLFLQSQDITAQRDAEEHLRQSEERFRLLVEAVEDYAIFILDPGGRVMTWNSGAQRIKGYAANEIIGQHFRVFYPEHMQSIGHPERELELAIQNGRYEEEGWRVRNDGSQFWASVLITTMRNHAGEHVGFAKVTRNIEERRRMLLDLENTAQALAATNQELEAANARLAQDAADQAQFLAVTAHELRTPVSVLSGSASLLVEHWDRMDPADRADLYQSISSSGKRLQRLLRDLLTASRLESRSIDLHVQDVDVIHLLETTVTSALATTPGADIRVEAGAGLRVAAEADRLAQAIDNLLTNALRHGSPPVRVGARARGDRVEITIADGGPGVPQEMRDRLFQRFTTGSAAGGTGLGLFIVRELARAQGGDAWYEPAAGSEPSQFVLSLPAASRAATRAVQ
jgi:PAS domain S-box-containing protein